MKKTLLIITAFLVYISSASAQWSIDSLSTPNWGLTTTQNGSKAFFASSAAYEIYDFSNGTWSIKNMPVPRPSVSAATANGVSYFGGGGFIATSSYNFFNNVDIYKSATSSWSTKTLSNARIVGASAAVGNKVFFAGGRQILNYSNRVDIFDVTTGVRTTHNLSQARTAMAVAVVGSKVIFAGGAAGNISNGIYTTSNKVDIYDDATGLWSTALLSTSRELITAAVVGNKVLFAGGRNANGTYSKVIDIYDASTNTWSTLNMSETKYGIAAATSGSKVYLAGGTISNSGALTNRVEIYDATTNTISYISISSPRMNMAVAQTPQRILFAGGNVTWGNVGTNRIEVLDLTTYTWSVEYLSRPRIYMAAVSYGNKAMFAGGAEVLSSYPVYSIISKRVDIWTDSFPFARKEGEGKPQVISANSISVFPNPFTNTVSFQIPEENIPAVVSVFDVSGRLVRRTEMNEAGSVLNFSDLNNGIYLMQFETDGKINKVIKVLKQ